MGRGGASLPNLTKLESITYEQSNPRPYHRATRHGANRSPLLPRTYIGHQSASMVSPNLHWPCYYLGRRKGIGYQVNLTKLEPLTEPSCESMGVFVCTSHSRVNASNFVRCRHDSSLADEATKWVSENLTIQKTYITSPNLVRPP
jgi:hypothetical protein